MSNYNCIVCAYEFKSDEMHNIKLSSNNVTKFKICGNCLNLSDPQNDYQEVKSIIDAFKLSESKECIIEIEED